MPRSNKNKVCLDIQAQDKRIYPNHGKEKAQEESNHTYASTPMKETIEAIREQQGESGETVTKFGALSHAPSQP